MYLFDYMYHFYMYCLFNSSLHRCSVQRSFPPCFILMMMTSAVFLLTLCSNLRFYTSTFIASSSTVPISFSFYFHRVVSPDLSRLFYYVPFTAAYTLFIIRPLFKPELRIKPTS